MPSLNVDIDFFDHPKTKRLIRLLGRGSEVVPLRMWCYTARYFPADGRLTGISAQEIEEECRWWGQSGNAITALLDCGFLEQDGDTFVVHDWLEHEKHIGVFRERAKSAAEGRWEKERGKNGDASSIATSIATCDATGTATSDAITLQSSTLHDIEIPPTPRASKKLTADEVPIPDSLNTPEFLKAWETWKQYRRDRKPAVTGFGAKAQLKEFEKKGLKWALDAIECAIKNDWQGIFDPYQRGRNGNGYDRSAAARREFKSDLPQGTRDF